jgi:hypothetical protein
MQKIPNIPHFGSAIALTRFFLRLMIFSVFATFGSQGFSKAFSGMLMLAAICCIVAAAIRREHPFGPDLTHFDEAAADALIAVLAVRMA